MNKENRTEGTSLWKWLGKQRFQQSWGYFLLAVRLVRTLTRELSTTQRKLLEAHSGPSQELTRSLVETAQTAETMQGLKVTMARSEERAFPGCKFGGWRGMRSQRQSWEAAGCKILQESM